MELLLGLSFIIMAVIPIIRTKQVAAPYVLVSGIWGLYMILYAVVNPNYLPLGNRFYISIMLWVVFFYIGAILGQYLTIKSHNKNIPDSYIIKIYYTITPIFAIISSYITISQALNSSNIFLYLRMMSTGLDENIEAPDKGIFVYLTSLILVLFLIELATYGLKRKKIVLTLFFFNLLLAIISMSKSIIFSTFISAIIILILRKEISIKKIVGAVLILVIIFIGMQSARSQDDGINYSFFSHYFFANAVAFEYADINNNLSFGAYVFRIIYAIGNKLGLTEAPVQVIMDYTYVGNGATNTYTVLYPFFHDFGYLGVAIFALLLGIIGGVFYKKSFNSIPAKVFYAILGSTFLFQLFGEILFTNASLYIQYLLYAYIPFIIKSYHGRNFNGHIQRGTIY